jgi:amino acid transporter
MAAINDYRASSESPDPHKGGYGKEQDNVNIASGQELEEETGHHLHRGLKARQITMIAIGGAIGTGLIIGT